VGGGSFIGSGDVWRSILYCTWVLLGFKGGLWDFGNMRIESLYLESCF
jgi:hypothetical protein